MFRLIFGDACLERIVLLVYSLLWILKELILSYQAKCMDDLNLNVVDVFLALLFKSSCIQESILRAFHS